MSEKKISLTKKEKEEIRKKLDAKKREVETQRIVKEADKAKKEIDEQIEYHYGNFLKYTKEKDYRNAKFSFKFFCMMKKISQFMETMQSFLRTLQGMEMTWMMLERSNDLLKSVVNIKIGQTGNSLKKNFKKFRKAFGKFDSVIDEVMDAMDSVFEPQPGFFARLFGRKKKETLSDEEKFQKLIADAGLDLANLPDDPHDVKIAKPGTKGSTPAAASSSNKPDKPDKPASGGGNPFPTEL